MTSCIAASTSAMISSVRSRRVPTGAFTSTLNWPASTRGKSSRPSSLRPNTAPPAATSAIVTTTQRARITVPTSERYAADTRWKIGPSSLLCSGMNFAAKAGITVIATTYDVTLANVTARASGVKR